jgi:Polysaccharide lyase family 4, domain II
MTIGILCLLPFAFCHAGDHGTVTGFVKFPGETAPRNMFANGSDHDCPHGIPQTHLLVKQETRGLQNVLVVLERRDHRVMPSRLQAPLSAKGCQLLPRVQWLPLGTSLLLVNNDGAMHHLHAVQGDNTLFEADLTPEHPHVRRALVVPGLYKINCDKHLWERAWILVSPHDSVAVTDRQGEFTMKNVPPGRYRLRVWHEGWLDRGKDRDGRLEFQPEQQIQNIQVREDEATEAHFDDLAPTFAVPSD